MPPAPKKYPIQWVHIDDFSPGCFANTYVTPNQAAPTGSPFVPAPLGAATPRGTWACASLRAGGLGPLPNVTQAHAIGAISGASTQLIAGFICNPAVPGDELVEIVEADDGSNHHFNAYSIQAGSGATNVITNPTSPSTAGFFGAPYPVFSRMNTSGTGNPPPCLVFPSAVASDSHGTNGHLYVYPQLLSPGTYGAQDLVVPGTSGITGQVVAYGSRIICLAGIPYTWPTGSVITNENFNYTDPPLSSGYGNQQSVLGAEWPWGYGAWGSVSVGELLLVKKWGGAVILYGDIANPTSAIEIPGVTPTGNIVGRAAATPGGLIYCSEKRGAWLWNGGNTATKISQQLEDDFFDLETGTIQSNNYGFNVTPWQGWTLFSHNWLHNSESNSWWILYPTTDQASQVLGIGSNDLWWYTPGQFGNIMYAAPLISSSSNGYLGYIRFDSTMGSSEYRWQSLPIHVAPDADRVIDVRQLVIRASDPFNQGGCTIQANVGLWQSPVTGGIGQYPTMLRFNVGTGALGLEDIDGLVVHAWNTGGLGTCAPIIHSIDVGYQLRAKIAVGN